MGAVLQVKLRTPLPRGVSVLRTSTTGRTVARSCRRGAGEEAERRRVGEEEDVMVRPETSRDEVLIKVKKPLHLSVFHFELIMLLVLGCSLPVVYWRKIRIRHL